MQTLLPDCSVRKLQPVNADIEKIYAMASQNTLFYQYHPPFVTWQSILDDMSALPPGKTMADKFYIGFFDGAALVAVVDMILAYPNESTILTLRCRPIMTSVAAYSFAVWIMPAFR